MMGGQRPGESSKDYRAAPRSKDQRGRLWEAGEWYERARGPSSDVDSEQETAVGGGGVVRKGQLPGSAEFFSTCVPPSGKSSP